MSGFKEGTLAARWRANGDGSGPDVVIYYPCVADGHLLNSALCTQGFIQELERRGYDLTTLQFTIRKKGAP